MGACQCKCCSSQDEDRSNLSAYDAPSSSHSNSVLGINSSSLNRDLSGSKKRAVASKVVDNLILQTLNMIGKLGLVGYVPNVRICLLRSKVCTIHSPLVADLITNRPKR